MGISQTKLSQPRHPYYPTDIVLPGYVPNTLHFSTLLSGFGAAVIALFVFTYMITKWRRPNISIPDILKAQWFVLCKFPTKSMRLSYFHNYFQTNV
jgi:cholestenol delta-isomerase